MTAQKTLQKFIVPPAQVWNYRLKFWYFVEEQKNDFFKCMYNIAWRNDNFVEPKNWPFGAENFLVLWDAFHLIQFYR